MFFDPVRSAVLRETEGGLREWDGTAWTILEDGMSLLPHAIAFDAGRGRLIALKSLVPGGPAGVLVRDLLPMSPRVVSGSSTPPSRPLGGTIDLTANVGGAPGWTPQWHKDGVPLMNGGSVSGATSTHLVVTALTCADYGDYEFRAAHSCGEATMTWPIRSFDLAVNRSPETPNVSPGAHVTFTANIADANGVTSHAYQWRRGGVNLANGDGVSGVTTPVLDIAAAHHQHVGVYDVVVSIACGGARTSAALALGVICHGDANGDGMVTFADLNLVLSNFGAVGPAGSVPGDVTGNGVVNFEDLNLVLGFFGQAC